jgi:hypothetical protein
MRAGEIVYRRSKREKESQINEKKKRREQKRR